MANNGKSYSVQKELDKKYGVKGSSGRASGNTSVQDTLDQKYSYENSNQRRTSVQDWSRRYSEAARAYGETGGTLTDESGDFRNRVNALIQDYDKIKGYSGRMGLPNGQDYIRALRGMVDATGKNRQRAATASGLLPEDASTLAGQKQKYERMLFELQKQRDTFLKDNPQTVASGAFAETQEITPMGNYGAIAGQDAVGYGTQPTAQQKQLDALMQSIRETQGTIGDINSRLNIYNRIDKFGDDVTAKYAGGNSMEAREAWRGNREATQDTIARQQEEAAGMFDKLNETDEYLDAKYAADNAADGARVLDKLDEYLTWFDGLSEESQRRIKSSDVNGQNPYRDSEIIQNDPGYQNKHWGQMTEDERNAVFQIANTEGTEAAAKYLDDLQMTLDRRQTLAMEQNEKDRAEKTPLIGDMLRGVATVPGNLIGAPVSFIGNVIDKTQGKSFNPYSNANFLLNQSGAVREASSQEVYKAVAGDGSSKIMNALGELASNAYQAGLSTLDSLAGMATMGKFYTVSMGMGAASQRMRELVESGASDREIYVGAIGSGILEALFEKVSLDTFADQWIKGNPEKFIRKALIQAGVEGSEEVFTEISNQILDAVNRGVNSDHNVRVRALMKENPGMSETEAEQQAASEDAQEVFWAGFGGALSGGLSSFGGLAIEGHKARQGGTEILSRGQAGEVLQNALELRPNDKAAQNLQAKLSDNTLGKKGRDLSGLYRVAQQNAADMTRADVEAVRAGLEKRLTEMGVPNNGKATAEAIIKQITGEKLSLTDRLALAKNRDAAATVLSEIISAAIEETAENKWVRDIKTFQLGRLGNGKQAFGTAETQTQKSARETMEKALNQVMGSNSAIVSAMYDEGQSRSDFTTEAAEIYRAGQDGRGLDSVSLSTIGAEEAGIIYDMGVRSAEGMGTYDYIEEGQTYRKSDNTPVNVTGFASMGAEPTVSIGNGETVKASDITFGSFGESRLYNTIAKMGVDTQTANDMLKAAESANINASTYSVALNNAYMQGLSGIAFGNIRENSEAMRLDGDTRKAAWSAGRAQAERNDRAKQSVTDNGKHGRKAGGLTVEDSAKNVNLNRQQETAMNAARVLTGMGLNVSVFASTEAERKGDIYNGIFRSADGSIRVDLNAGKDGQGVMGYALSHEFTHFVEELSAEKFRKFTDVLFDVLGKSDVDVNRLIEAKEAVLRNTEEYKGRSEKELRAIAYSEAVAEMMEPVLTDTDAISRISQKIKQQDKSLWGKIKDFIKGIVEKLKAAYRDMEPDSAIARLTRETVTNSEAVLDAFSEAAADAVLNYNLQEAAKQNGLRYSDDTFTNRNGESVDYLKSARITDKETLDFLNDQETVTTYKTMQLVDGKLYPPMAAVIQGSYEDASELGKWEMAVEHPELIKDVNGKAKFTLNKGKGQGSLAAAYNPYMHSSNLVLNDQFSGAYLRPNLVTVECKVPVSELTSGYKAQYAKDSVGWHSWHTGTVAGALRQQTGVERQVLLSRYIMPVRILSNAEVAGMYAELLNGTGIAVPDNVVPPALLAELEKAGVEIAESGRVKYSSRTGKKFSYQYFSQKQDVTITDIDADVGIDRKTIRNAGITSALNVGSRNKYGAVDVYVNDIGSNVVVGKDGISHGLRRENKGTPSENYIVAANAGPILKNSILINELTPKNENADGSYVLVGIAKDQYNTGYVVESIVNKFTNKLESMDVLYSMNAKKELAALNAPRATPKALPVTSSDYTVPSVLNLVKEHFPDILPEDVLKHYGYESRPDGKLGESVLYSARQETKNLVALHNLTEEKLLKSLELGGFPMPSIAITKADIPHTNFGDITVVFGKETIDPKARRENTVYSADAWTPVVPRVEYEADSKVTDRVYNRLGALKNQVAEYFQHDLDTLRYSLEDRLNRDGGEAGILENLRNNYALKAAFLEEQGTHIEQQTKQVETAVNSISSEMEDKLLNVWEALGKPTPDEIGSTSMKEIRDTYGSELEKAYPGMTKSAFRMSTVLGKLRAYLSGEANATKTSVVADGEAMKKAVDAAVDQGAFERWARELFSGIEKSKGVYNGKERFTPSGNLRSFKATHIPATLEGIVQAMRSENGGNTKNVSGFSGVKTLRAATAEEFGSIADMHRAEGRLQNLTEEQVSQIQDKLGDRLYKLMNDIDAANTKSRWSDNSFIRMDSIGENLTEIGESGRYTPENVKRVFAKYGMEVSDHTAQEVVQLLFDISQMPVNIFEAKPKRAVRFEEIRNVLVPDTASQKLLRELDNRGIPYQVYEAGNEAQRQQMVSQMDDVRFSSRAQQDSEYLNLAQNSEENREVLSRMVENAAREAGYTRLFFHGSKKGGGFTVFRDWQYFTENREYAKRYANRENPGSLYETYVKMENPFDTRIPEVRELFEQARQEYGMGELQENGLPDWTDGYDIADYIDENDLPYDGIILDEGGDMVNGKPVSRGLSYVIRDSSQVKSADAVTYDDNGDVIPLSQRFDMGKENIRYSARNPQAQVEAENERLKSDVKRQIAEAVREYRRQQDVQSKAYRQMYERQLEEVKKSYQKQISSMESEYSANLAQIQDAFFQTVEAYEKGQFRNEHLEKVLKQAAETQRAQAKASEADNATWEKEFNRLLRAYETSGRDVQRLKQTVENQRARAKAKVEAARVTEQRGKLYRAVNEINRRLLNPTKTLYVPDSLAPAVTKFMQGLTEAMESPKNSWNVQGALETLQGQYRKLTQMNEGVFTQEYNQGILDLLDNAISAVGGTDFNKLSASQIEDVYSAVRSVLTAIRNENKMFAANLNKTYAEAAEAVRREEAALPNRKPTTGAVQDKAEKFGWNQLKPVYAMMRLGSDTLLKQYNNLRAGEDKWQRTIAAARAYGLGIMEKYHYDQWNDSLMKLDTETGTVELSLEERMSLYAYARREQAFEHLTKGGFVLSDENTRTVKNRFGIKTEQKVQDYNAYVLTAEQVAGIRGAENILQLTEEQRQFADAMQDYLSTVCAELNNEISRALYGVSVAKEKYYWPIKSSGVFSEMIRNQMQNPSNRQKNAGHMKATVRGANNAIELMGFMETWATHVNNTAMYNAFTLPMEDFMRVWNWRDTRGLGNRSMRQLILQKHGQAGVDYIDTFIKDLNKGVRGDPRESLLNSMLGKFKKGAVSASLSVAIQQPSAVGRALKYIDPKYFLGARVEGVDGINATWEVMQQYAPVVGIKDIGRFDMDMGRSTIDILSGKNETGVRAAIDKLSGFLPEYMDKVTWVAMWEACKRQVKAQNPSLRGEALLTKAGALFTKTITETQVYDSVFSRSGLMRSPNVAAKAVTAFMAEPTTTANMVYQAIQDFRHGDRTGAARSLASVGTAIVLNSLLASLVYASRDDDEEKTWLEKYLKSFTAEMIDGVNPLGYIPVVKDIFSVFQGYDVIRSDMSQWADLAKTLQKFTKAWKSYGEADEDDREARKEALKNAGIASTNLLASILNLGGIPLRNLLREIQDGVNIVKDIQRGLPSDSRTKGYAIWEALNEYMPQIMRRDDGKAKQVYKAVTSGSAAWVNRLKSTYKNEDTFNRAVVTALVNNDSRIREAARAAVSGNSAERDRLAEEIVKEGRFTEEQVEAAIEKRIGQLPGANYDDMLDALRNGGDVKAAQAELAKYGYTQTQMESEVKSAAKEWYQGGVISAIDARKMLRDYGGMLTRDAQATVQKWTALLSTGTDFDEIQDEYLTGNLSRSRAVEMYVKFGGHSQADAEATVKKWDCEKDLGIRYDDLKDAYLGGDISADKVLSAMVKYGGVKEDSARATVDAYKWIRQHPKTELDVGQVKTYTKAIDTLGYSVEDAGISESVYLTFIEQASACTGADKNGDGRTDSGSVQNQVVQVIDALPISGAQKDALYFAKGYARRNLHKTPWH
jgi:hypothetical protein|nr:MAG TPA: nuclease [Caudoviricetes sp.]